MHKLFEHIRLLPGRGIVCRRGAGYGYGEMWLAPGTRLAGRQVSFARAEATFQKGKSHYAIVLLRNCEPTD
jgi:hypothetical protein